MQTKRERDRHISEELRMETMECVSFLLPDFFSCLWRVGVQLEKFGIFSLNATK